jgi:hypothetical protein
VRSQVRRLILVAWASAALAGCAAAPTVTRFAVHVDTLDPAKLGQFEAARVRWVAALRARGLSDRRGLYLKIGDHTYYSVVPFGRWGELDRLGQERQRTNDKMGAAAAAYDRESDDSLVFPHASEIWRELAGLAYLPTGRPLEQALELVIEDVKPMHDYEAAWRPIAAALATVNYPVERRTFFSSYGSGRHLSFWLAPSRAVLDAAPTLQQALVTAVGEAQAALLLQGWQACVLRTQTFVVDVHPEMTAN